MRKLTLNLSALPAWVWVVGFFALIAILYIILGQTMGFEQEARLFK